MYGRIDMRLIQSKISHFYGMKQRDVKCNIVANICVFSTFHYGCTENLFLGFEA